MTTRTPVGDQYVLATGEAARSRLHLLDRVYGEATHRALREAGLAPEIRAADIGSGVGDVACWLARGIGARGSVIGIDVSIDQIGEATDNAKRQGVTNVEFREGSAYESGLPRAAFDIVVCRFVLAHLARVPDALREMWALLKPGGSLVSIEPDWASIQVEPPSEPYHRMVEICCRGGTLRGADYRIAVHLHQRIRDAGLPTPSLRFEQPAFLTGEEKRLPEYTMVEAAPAMIRAGLLTEDEFHPIAAEMAAVSLDPTRLVIQPRVVVAIIRKQLT